MKPKLLLNYNYFDKVYNEDTDTAIYTLAINNSLWNIEIIIKIFKYCSLTDGDTTVEIISNDISQFYKSFDCNESYNSSLELVQDFLIINNLLLYVKGFGIPSFSNKVNIYQHKPQTEYNYESKNSSKDR